MNRKILAIGAGAVGAATLAFGAVVPATAAEAPPGSIIVAVCNALPASVTSLTAQLAGASAAVISANADMVAKKAAVAAAVTDLVNAVVAYIQTVNNGGNVGAAGQVLTAKSSVFADKVVAENNAMTAWFEAQRSQFLTGQTQGYVSDVQALLCAPPAPPAT